MPRILYGVSPIGLGHATRTLVVVNELRRAGAEVRIFSGGKAAEFLAEEEAVANVVSDPVPHTVNGKMDRVALWYIRSWYALRKTMPKTRQLVSDFRPDLVVCDEEFSGILAATEMNVRRAFVTDELELGFASSWVAKKIEKRVSGWYENLQRSAGLVLIPDFGKDTDRVRYVGPIVRPVTADPEETRRVHGIPPGRYIVLSLSGSGMGGHLFDETMAALSEPGLSDVNLVVTGNRGARFKGGRVLDLGLVRDNQNLVAAADLVVSTAGKSTIDEAASSGTPIITIPIKNHAEQERNAAALGYSFNDMHGLRRLVAEKIGKREAPRSYRGAEEASRLILTSN